MPTNNWRGPVCGYKQGQSHVKEGLECQDYVDVCDSGAYTIAALADGVGSRRLSRTAAVEAVKETIRWFILNADQLGGIEQPQDGVHKIRNALLPQLHSRIREWALENSQDVRNMDCNLAFVFIRKNPVGEDRAYYGVLGDCAVCVIGADDRMRTVCGARPESMATDSVMYPPSYDNFLVYHSYVEQGDIRGFLLTSDGLEYKAYVKGSPYVYHGAQDYYNAIFARDPENEIQQLFQRLQQSSSVSDDLSVAVLSRDDAPRTFRKDPYWLCRCGHKNNVHNLVCSNCKRAFLEIYENWQQECEKKGFKNRYEYFLDLNQRPKDELLNLGLAPGMEPLQKERPKKPTEPAKPAPVKQEKPMIKPQETKVNVQHTSKEGQVNGPKDTITPMNADGKKGEEQAVRKPLLQMILCGAAIVLILLNILLSVMDLWNGYRDRDMKAALSGQMQEIQESITDLYYGLKAPDVSAEMPESHMLQMADGSVYYGEMQDGVPHGYGFVQSESSIASGKFVNGQKHGLFMIRSLEEPQELSVANYIMGSLIDGPRKIGYLSGRSDMLTSVFVTSEVTAYADHVESEEESWVIPADTMIYLTGEYFCEDTGRRDKTELWLKICGLDGMTGWCRAADLDMFEQ